MTDTTNPRLPVDHLAEDIRKADGNHDLGAAALAEALIAKGWTQGEPEEYPRAEADTIVLGPEIFASTDRKVISWQGQNYVPQKEANPQPALSAYKDGEQIEVMKNGEWRRGHVTSRDRVSGHLHVHTERGPVTVASTHGARKLA